MGTLLVQAVRKRNRRPGGAVCGDSCKDNCRFGVLFVDGFGQQRPGDAIAALGAALHEWLYKWNSKQGPEWQPVLSDVVLSSVGGEGDPPAHMTLSARLPLTKGPCDARWLLAESSWAEGFRTPRFLGIARWVWKVSVCLLVMEFFVPMCRHWGKAQAAERAKDRAPERAIVLVYVALMGVAAMLSVLVSGLLLVLALAAYLPIPRIDQAVRWVVVQISAVLGDTYMLAHCPVQYAAMRTRVARDLDWLQGNCCKVTIVAHSQGAAIVHQILKERHPRRDRVAALITLGQAITKFDLLWRMDWDLGKRAAAARSRWLVTAGMACAGLPAFSLVAGHWLRSPLLTALVGLPVSLLLIAVGLAAIAIGVREAMRTFAPSAREDLILRDVTFTWSDYYASADPVSNGPLNPSGKLDANELMPRPCNQVYNSGSVVFDHNGYLRNQDEFVTSLLNDLAFAAYGQQVRITDSADEASDRRRRLVQTLMIIRVLTVAVLAGTWWGIPGQWLRHPLLYLLDLASPHAGMTSGTSRILTAVLTTAAFYTVALLGWRYAMNRSVNKFFANAPTRAQAPPEPAESVARDQATLRGLADTRSGSPGLQDAR